jgi:uncharacterized protein (DUF2225 family)
MRVRSKPKEEDKELKISFIAKKDNTCPACGAIFRKEELLSGGGRLIAGALTMELHRLYEPSVKYGEIFPLVYSALVCPECWFASMEMDFPFLPQQKVQKAIDDRNRRMADTRLIFPNADFKKPRGLLEGAASQYLVLRCYDFYVKQTSPTIKQGLASIRTAWLLDELDKKTPNQHYNWLATLFRKKAQYFYREAINREMSSGGETMSGLKSFGPDTDKNYSYEGMLYLCAYLTYKYGPAQSPEERKTSLEEARRTIAKLFGMGRMSKDKPGAFLEQARKVYDRINKEVEGMEV